MQNYSDLICWFVPLGKQKQIKRLYRFQHPYFILKYDPTTISEICLSMQGCWNPGGRGVARPPPHILADHLTLTKGEGGERLFPTINIPPLPPTVWHFCYDIPLPVTFLEALLAINGYGLPQPASNQKNTGVSGIRNILKELHTYKFSEKSHGLFYLFPL